MAYKNITFPTGIASGGTNTTVFTPYAVVLGPKADNTSLQDVGGIGSSGQVLTSNGAGTIPTWQTASSGSFSSRVRATLSADQAVNQNSDVKILLNSEDFDGLNEFSVTSSQFTTTTTGYYMVAAQISYESPTAAKDYSIKIFKNGAALLTNTWICPSTGVANITPSVSSVIALNATDYLELYANHGSSGAVDVDGDSTLTWLSIHRLS